jgi:sulfate transport system permease protein
MAQRHFTSAARRSRRPLRIEAATREAPACWSNGRCILGIALGFFTLFLLMPLLAVFVEALRKGWETYLRRWSTRTRCRRSRLTLLAAAIAVPLNLVFGVAAAWAIAKFEFRGKHLLITLIDLPFSVSPVIAGLIYVLVFGAQGWFGRGCPHDMKIIFAVPGIVLATVFVTFPFVARELIPLMQAQGKEEERPPWCSAPTAGRPSGTSPCPTSSGACCTA